MNLSRPEHYASDLLSAMEVIDSQDNKPIELHRAGRDLATDDGLAVPSRIAWPEGLVVVGTVNVDETTFSFAPKVLDRAPVLEFTKVNLDLVVRAWDAPEVANGKYTATYNQSRVKPWLDRVQAALSPNNLHLGYRAVRECLDFLLVQLGDQPKSWPDEAVVDQLDLLLRAKVLPRIRGPREAVEGLLVALYEVATCKELEEKIINDSKLPEEDNAERKVLQMIRRARDVGFTGYFG